MTRKPNAGDLFYLMAFDEPVAGSDGYGGTLDGFSQRFVVRAQCIHLRGGESVLAERLERRHVQVIRVRRSTNTLAVTTDWRVRNSRATEVFNIRDITPGEDRQFIDFLCEKGVAT